MVLSTWGEGLFGGLGFVGSAGSYVVGNSLGNGGVIVHELGHNFNQHHSNKYTSLSEKPNSDEVVKYEYGNPFSVMGNDKNIAEGGDFTIIGKVSSKLSAGDNFGYTIGNENGVDVAWLQSENDVRQSPFRLDENASPGIPKNTFRIYRHDYGHVPAPLYEGYSFTTEIPQSSLNIINNNFPGKTTFNVRFEGTGQGAYGLLDLEEAKLHILNGGSGYALEPQVMVLDEQNNTILPLDASWVK